MNRRDFLKISIALITELILQPLPVFVPPRDPFIYFGKGLDNLYSHLGILPSSRELSICEGDLLEIGKWDGVGYPCLIRNACSYSKNPAEVWVYDFDLYNFRHYDDLKLTGNIREFVAQQRFGKDWCLIAKTGNGYRSNSNTIRRGKYVSFQM